MLNCLKRRSLNLLVPNDEVIVPTLTFVATINSIIYNRANPIFFDVDNYFNIDQNNFETFIKKIHFLKTDIVIIKKLKEEYLL